MNTQCKGHVAFVTAQGTRKEVFEVNGSVYIASLDSHIDLSTGYRGGARLLCNTTRLATTLANFDEVQLP